MIILGIDPGLAIVGWGVIEAHRGQFRPIACGDVNTPAHTSV
ncbi:MAG: crossover junction endodeoxyribonuclease RuvC, partial [Clostridia bacterium]|nr:crossover junction endodeoxyribonuclease RuvC [Clostridia bacterium]